MKRLTTDKMRLRIAMALAGFGVVCLASPILMGQTALYRYHTSSVTPYKTPDEKLDAGYKQLYSMIDARGRERLEVTQRVWARFRDAQCKFESAQAQTPEAKAAAYQSAHDRLTQLRLAAINAQIGEAMQAGSPTCQTGGHCHAPR